MTDTQPATTSTEPQCARIEYHVPDGWVMNYTVYSQDTVRVSFGPGMSIFLDQHAIMSLRQQLDLAAAELIVEEAVIEPLMEAWEDAATPG